MNAHEKPPMAASSHCHRGFTLSGYARLILKLREAPAIKGDIAAE